jgi:hypothetical protein
MPFKKQVTQIEWFLRVFIIQNFHRIKGVHYRIHLQTTNLCVISLLPHSRVSSFAAFENELNNNKKVCVYIMW